MKLEKMLNRFRVDKPDKFRLADYDCADTCGLSIDKVDAKTMLADGVLRLAEMQERLYAENRSAVLAIFQAMDAAGKDGAIAHVMSGVNPQGCQVHAFKAPSAEELDHDFLWRIAKNVPERGRIGIFNRSHYEEVLVVRVHSELLAKQRLPSALVTKDIWEERFKSIRHFERHLVRNGTRVVKFFLHLSKEEQRKRFLKRIDDPEKNWKFSVDDIKERGFWKDYTKAFEACLSATSTHTSPWYVVPADDKETAQLIVSRVVLDALKSLKMSYPKSDPARRKELLEIRKLLENEK